MVRTVLLTILLSELAYNEMQASVRTCRRSAADSITPQCMLKSSHDPNCRLKSNHVKAIYFNHPSQGNSTNYYLILGPPSQGCASHKSTNKQIPSEASEESSDTVIHFYFYFFFILWRALFSANQRQCSSNRANVPRTC